MIAPNTRTAREQGDGTAGPARTAATGCDVSHRGGPAGFVEIDEAGLLLADVA
jgi:hypothetical protein